MSQRSVACPAPPADPAAPRGLRRRHEGHPLHRTPNSTSPSWSGWRSFPSTTRPTTASRACGPHGSRSPSCWPREPSTWWSRARCWRRSPRSPASRPTAPVSPSTEQIVSLGQALGVQALIMGTVTQSENLRSGSVPIPVVTLDLRMVETETGATVWAATQSEKGGSHLRQGPGDRRRAPRRDHPQVRPGSARHAGRVEGDWCGPRSAPCPRSRCARAAGVLRGGGGDRRERDRALPRAEPRRGLRRGAGPGSGAVARAGPVGPDDRARADPRRPAPAASAQRGPRAPGAAAAAGSRGSRPTGSSRPRSTTPTGASSPVLTLSARVYSSATGELVWAGFRRPAGWTAAGCWAEGRISSLEVLVPLVVRELLGGLAPDTSATAAPREAASSPAIRAPSPSSPSRDRRLGGPRSTPRPSPRPRGRVCFADGVRTLSPNRSHEILRRLQGGRFGGVTAETRDALHDAGGADTILTGAVEAYEVGGSELEPEPRVTIAMRLLDAATGPHPLD